MTSPPNARIGVYPGTFDPLTNGHLDIIRRAVKLVDHLVVAVAVSEAKKPMFSLDERVEMVTVSAKEIEAESGVTVTVRPFNILLTKFAEDVGAKIIVRGLRAVSDFEYEFQLVGMNDKLSPNIETVFLMADVQHQTIASRLVKEIAMLDGDITHFTPRHVAQRLTARRDERK